MTWANVLSRKQPWAIEQADCLEVLRAMPADCVDLVFTSPPYEQARLYLENGQDKGIARKTDAWVAWQVEVITECVRVCKGLVAFVVEGQTKNFRYSCGPDLLRADLCRAGFNLRKSPIFNRVGIPGSGGPDWLRNDYEPVVCVTRPGKLPWSFNTACGHPPKWAPGGAMSNRQVDGNRVNDGKFMSMTSRGKNGERKSAGGRRSASGYKNGDTATSDRYTPPALANPGNVIKCNVGGRAMGGDEFTSQNEAPFPEALAEFFVLSFCPPNGVCLDPFCGSGTTPAVSVRHGRRAIGIDLRKSQVDIATKRIQTETPLHLFT